MAYSKKNYTGDGVTKLFTVTFPYIDPSHIAVTLNGTPATFTFQSKFVIEFATAPAMGALIQIKRSSNPEGRLVDFQDDSMGTEALFDLNSDQLLFLAQEAMDNTLEGTVIEQVQDIADAALASALAAANASEDAQDAAASITLPLPIASGGTGVSSIAGLKTALSLGTAADRNTGTVNGTVPEVGAGDKLSTAVVPRLPGSIVQSVHLPITAKLDSSTIIPYDDTIPQITEGAQAVAYTFTATKATNRVRVEYLIYCSANNTSAWCMTALFRSDNANNASAASTSYYGNAGVITSQYGVYEAVINTSSPVTFSLRFGPNAAGTISINGQAAGRYLGGVYSSFMRITEYEV